MAALKIISTELRPADEDDVLGSAPFFAAEDLADTDNVHKVVNLCNDPERNRCVYTAAASVDAGTTLLTEREPLACVTLQPRAGYAGGGKLLFHEPSTINVADANDDAELGGLPVNMHWFLVLALMRAATPENNFIARIAAAARVVSAHSYAARVLEGDTQLDAANLRWVAYLRKRFPSYSWRDFVRILGMVSDTALEMHSALTLVPYGLVVYERVGAALPHSCDPNARLHLEIGGVARIVAIRPIAAGEPITLNRELPLAPSLVCIQTAAELVRKRAYANLGQACRCDACVGALSNLRRIFLGRKNMLENDKSSDAVTDDATAYVKVAIESLWKSGYDADVARLSGGDATLEAMIRDEVTTTLSFAESGPRLLKIMIAVGIAQLRAFFDQTRAEQLADKPVSSFAAELAVTLLAMALKSPLAVEDAFGADTTALLHHAATYAAIDGDRAIRAALQRQFGKRFAKSDYARLFIERRMRRYGATVALLRFYSLALRPTRTLLEKHADALDELGRLNDADVDLACYGAEVRAACTNMFAALHEYVCDGNVADAPRFKVAVWRVLLEVGRENSIFYHATIWLCQAMVE